MEQNTVETMSSEETQQVRELLLQIRDEFKGTPDELIPMLQKIQRSMGYLPESALLELAHMTGLPAARVFGVVTFYAQFRLYPVGKHIIRVCRGTACHVRGSGRILKDIQARLKVTPGETTRDRLFTLETVACFGSCALAPVVVADDSVRGRINSSKAIGILEEILETEEKPHVGMSNTRGLVS